MAAHARLNNEFTEDEKYHNLMTWLKWLEAFHVFVAIYTAKYPAEAPSLMKHTNIVKQLAKQAGDEAALLMSLVMRNRVFGVFDQVRL